MGMGLVTELTDLELTGRAYGCGCSTVNDKLMRVWLWLARARTTSACPGCIQSWATRADLTIKSWPDMIWHQLIYSHLHTFNNVQLHTKLSLHNPLLLCLVALSLCAHSDCIIISASLLVVCHRVSVKYYSWGTGAHLVVQPVDHSLAIASTVLYSAHCIVLCILNEQLEDQLTGHVTFWPGKRQMADSYNLLCYYRSL